MKRYLQIGLVAAISAAVGTAIGYYISKKELEGELERRLDEELAASREAVSRATARLNEVQKEKIAVRRVPGTNLSEADVKLAKDGAGADLAVSVDTLDHAVRALRYGPSVAVQDAKAVLQMNAFDTDPDELEEAAWQAEVENRDPSKPYIISLAEFSEMDHYSKVTLQFFMEDDTLIDDQEVPIENADDVVGLENLDRFGWRSGDNNVLYVRNDRLRADYEILHNMGSFGEAVHGVMVPKKKSRK